MIWVDYSITGLVLISLAFGYLRGFIKEAFSLVTWIAAVWVGLAFSRTFSVLLETIISYPSARIATAFALLFLLTLMLGAMISYLLAELVKKTGLTGFDRFIGMLFGIARGLIAITVIIVLAGLTPLPEDSWWKASTLIPYFQTAALWLRDYVPLGLATYINY